MGIRLGLELICKTVVQLLIRSEGGDKFLPSVASGETCFPRPKPVFSEEKSAEVRRWGGLTLLPGCSHSLPLESSPHEVLVGSCDVRVWKAMTNSPDDWCMFNIQNLKQTFCLLSYDLAFTHFLVWPSLLAAVLTDFRFFCCWSGNRRNNCGCRCGERQHNHHHPAHGGGALTPHPFTALLFQLVTHPEAWRHRPATSYGDLLLIQLQLIKISAWR